MNDSQLTIDGSATVSDAVISECGKYRYILSRRWDKTKQTVVFVGLNPSTADAVEDDPTIRRCINFAKSWGYGSLDMINLFAFRATQPKDMREALDPIGIKNDFWIRDVERKSRVIIAAWGTNGSFKNRDEEVKEILKGKLHYLKLTQNDFPSHPLYLKKDLKPQPYQL